MSRVRRSIPCVATVEDVDAVNPMRKADSLSYVRVSLLPLFAVNPMRQRR